MEIITNPLALKNAFYYPAQENLDFPFAYSFRKRLTLEDLRDAHILQEMAAVKTINPIAHEALVRLIQKAGI